MEDLQILLPSPLAVLVSPCNIVILTAEKIHNGNLVILVKFYSLLITSSQ